MGMNIIDTAQQVKFKDSALEEVRIALAGDSDGAARTLSRDYMKPVREYIDSSKAGQDGLVFLCPKQNKQQAAFLAAQAYLVMGNTMEGSDEDLMDSVDEEDFLYDVYEDNWDDDNDADVPVDVEHDLLVIDYAALFEAEEHPGGEMIQMQKLQAFRESAGVYKNALLICGGNVNVDHFLHVYRTLNIRHRAICFYGQQDEFLIKRVTFELQTAKNQVIILNSPGKQEYLTMLQDFLETNGFEYDKLASPLLASLMNYRKDLFTEQDIYDHVGKGMMQNDFSFAYTGKCQESAVERLDELIGLTGVKDQVKRAVVAQIISENSGIPTYGHMIFAGRPGTAKTTCARLYNEILTELSLSNGRFVEAGRSDIIGSYLGETAPKVKELFDRADGGMIFIDEAGFLQKTEGRGDMYVKEAVTELVRHLENNPQTRVIFATYPEYAKGVLEADPGLSSRLKVLQFPSYTEEELLQILFKMVEDRHVVIEDNEKKAVEEAVLAYLRPMMEEEDFGNGRELRKLLETALEEYGMEAFYGKNKKLLPGELPALMPKPTGKKKKFVLTAEHFKKAAEHIKNGNESLEKDEKKHRKIGFVIPIREGVGA